MAFSENDWRRLLDNIQQGRVVPLLGPGVVHADVAGIEAPLFQHLVPELTGMVGQEGLRESPDLRSLARSYAKTKASRDDLLSDCRRVLAKYAKPGQALLALASIPDFKLYLSSTPDGLLAKALEHARPGFDATEQSFAFCPNGNSGKHPHPNATLKDAYDIPETFEPPLIYHLLGAHFAQDFALWDEDWMEYVLALAKAFHGNGLSRLGSILRDSSLLMIGTPSDDWICRFLLRIVRDQPLSKSDPSRSLLADRRGDLDTVMVSFFEEATTSLKLIDMPPKEFAIELAARWTKQQGESAARAKSNFFERLRDSCPPRSVFISYDRRDAETVAELGSALLNAGVPVWVDKRALAEGQNYENEIRRAVMDCAFFISLVSPNSEEKSEPTHLLRKERIWASSRHDDASIFYLIVSVQLASRSDIRAEPEPVRKLEVETLSPKTLPSFVRRVKALYDEFEGPTGRPRR